MENDLARIEKALFGHETEDFVEVGLFEQAHNGTLYLDNVSHFPMEIQCHIEIHLEGQLYPCRR